MSHHAGALALAETQVAVVRDDPAARLALMARVFRWQARRGVLKPLDASPPGSVWWRRRISPARTSLQSGSRSCADARFAGRP
jgi:hypothetical protein